MANTSRNFVAGKMNKGLDERLLPNGQYIDAVNVRLGSTETTEIGAVENSKGNEQLTTLNFNGVRLSTAAICLGAYALGEQETMFWFVHDPSYTQGATGKCDMIVSFNTNTQTLVYHIISIDDGGGVNTTLNFDPEYLVLGVDFVDNLLFFTDNNNPPRFINVDRNYTNPNGSFVDQFSGESILVIKRPPYTAPLIVPTSGGVNNYLEDRFVCFGYRYKYADNEYSATSPFSPPSFIPGPFQFTTSSFLNEGMLNTTNIAEITYNSGGELVIGIDLLFKDMNNGTIKVIEKLDKSDLGIPNNSEQQYTFSNSKIFTILTDSEILRLYDNVPLKAKAQTLMGNRLMYGNYFEGYDLVDSNGTAIKLEYTTELLSEAVEFQSLEVELSAGGYTIEGGPAVNIPDTVIQINFANIDLVAGASIAIDFDIVHDSWGASGNSLTETNSNIGLTYVYILTQDYSSLQDLVNDQAFLDSFQLLEPVFADACDGTSLTDEFNCALQLTLDTNYEKTGTGITGINEPFFVATNAPGQPDILQIQINAAQYVDSTNPANIAYEYFNISIAEAEYTKVANATSLKSNRGYEIGIIYLDEYLRASTALVSPNNTQYVPCDRSISQNKIRVEIPTTQLPPAFAKYYKLCIKPDKENYDVIYTNLFYRDATLGATWFRLEGENAQKVEAGDTLFVKADTNGPKLRCTEVTVLEKESQEADFITPFPVDAAGDQAVVPSGTYMLINTNQIATELGDNPVVTSDQNGRGNNGDCPKVYMNVCTVDNPDYDPAAYNPADPTTYAKLPLDIPQGSTLRINYFNRRNGGSGNACELRECIWETVATASQDYANVKDFWDGDNIFGLTSQAECRTDTSDAPSDWSYDSALGNFNVSNIFGLNVITTGDLGCSLGTNFIRFLDYNGVDSNYSGWQLLGMTGTKGCGSNRNRRSTLDVEITIVRTNSIIIFESDPQDAAPDLWYESSKTYPIFNEECSISITVDAAEPNPLVIDYAVQGLTESVTVNPGATQVVYGDCGSAAVSVGTPPVDPANVTITDTPLSGAIHTGNIQNQTPTQPAIIDSSFFNCYTFGNGVESFKIQDSIIGKPLELGNRVTSTSEQDYKEAHRFADITYSGVINDETNVNRLNQFNLGLLNFKPLEDKYGPITVLDGRETDILCLQEDKISYVLQGKNLLSDSAGGGSIASVPEVLGTQIARVEDYGNSNNPESYVQWGADKFFTDAKRGAVIQLKGTAGQTEQLAVISETGMRSFFRDYFIESFNTFKFGGYDPYMNEYVLNRSDRLQPLLPPVISCGVTQSIIWTGQNNIQYIYELGASVGPVDVTFDVTNYDGTPIPILGVYNGVNVISDVLNADGAYSFTFNKSVVSADELFLQFGSVPATNDSVNIEFTVTCPDAPLIDIIQVAVTSNNEAGQLIHDEYRWTDGVFVSALQSEQVLFGAGTGLIVSQFTQTQAPQGGNLVPANGATIRIISNKIIPDGDDFIFNPLVNKFKYLRTNTVYTNSPASVASLLANPSTLDATPITGGGNTYEALFTMPNNTDNKLYLIWDYRQPTNLDLCYSTVSAEEACCDCDGDPVPSGNRFANLCIDAEAVPGKGQRLEVVIPPSGGVTSGSFISITSDPSCVYVVGAETENNTNAAINSVFVTLTNCNQVCNTYTFTGGPGGGTYTYVDCGGQAQSGELPELSEIEICAREIGLTNVTATMECSCVLTWEVERCQLNNTGAKPLEYIQQDGVVQVGDIVTLQGFGACTYNVIQSSNIAQTAVLNSTVAECSCDEYNVENITTSTETFTYTDCNDQVQTVEITGTGVATLCMKFAPAIQPNFSITYYDCGCSS